MVAARRRPDERDGDGQATEQAGLGRLAPGGVLVMWRGATARGHPVGRDDGRGDKWRSNMNR